MIHVIENCLFEELTSSSPGTALYLSSAGEFIIQNCYFYKCNSSVLAPGIYINSSRVNFKNLCFYDCTAPSNPPILYKGIIDYKTIFTCISIDSCKTITEFYKNGGPFQIDKTNAKLSESNFTNIIVNHIAAAQNLNTHEFKYKYCNVINNEALKEGVILQFQNAPGTELSYINIISNKVTKYALLRAVKEEDTVSISFSNFITNTGNATTGPITSCCCFSDVPFTLEDPLEASVNIPSNFIDCNYNNNDNVIIYYENYESKIANLVYLSVLFCCNSF